MTYPVQDEPVRRFRDVMSVPADSSHMRGGSCWCRPVVEGAGSGDIIVHRAWRDLPRSEREYVAEQGESDL